MAKESGIKKQEPGEAKAVPIAIGRVKAKRRCEVKKTVSPGDAIDTNSAPDTQQPNRRSPLEHLKKTNNQ